MRKCTKNIPKSVELGLLYQLFCYISTILIKHYYNIMEILGIDIGGTGIKGAIVNANTGTLTTERHRIPTPRPATPKAVAKVIKQMVEHFEWKGLIGCGFPTPLHHGMCTFGSNLHPDWKGVQVDALFKETTGNTFFIVNDADAAGLAEIHFGAGKDKKGVIMVITVGTGIGSGLFLNGKLLPDTEFGHIFSHKGDIFERYCADSVRRKEGLSKKRWAKRLDKYFKHLDFILSPELIIVGGGASKKFDKLKPYFTVNVPVVAASSQNEAGIIGAAMAAKDI